MVTVMQLWLCLCVFVAMVTRLVVFADKEGADKAICELNGTELDDRKIFLRKVWVIDIS